VDGPSNTGKSITIENLLEGRKNVVYITLRNNTPRESLLDALSILKTDKKDLQVPEIMLALKEVLRGLKKQPNYGTLENLVPVVVISDYIANNDECKKIAGNVLQFVEEQLASGIYLSHTYVETELPGHASRLARYTLRYADAKELEKYPFYQNADVIKLGGHFGQIFQYLRDAVPKARMIYPEQCKETASSFDIIEKIVQGEVVIPENDRQRIVEAMVQRESDEIFNVLCKTVSQQRSSNPAVTLLTKLCNSDNNAVAPLTFPELLLCEEMVKANILSHEFNETNSYTWHRPLLKHAFKAGVESSKWLVFDTVDNEE
jgi:hypothetical protein